jgi:hypothetical protein
MGVCIRGTYALSEIRAMLEKEKREQMTVAAQRTDFAGAWQKRISS